MLWMYVDPLSPILLLGMVSGFFSQHPLEHIINVLWDEGLAVEFGNKDQPPENEEETA